MNLGAGYFSNANILCLIIRTLFNILGLCFLTYTFLLLFVSTMFRPRLIIVYSMLRNYWCGMLSKQYIWRYIFGDKKKGHFICEVSFCYCKIICLIYFERISKSSTYFGVSIISVRRFTARFSLVLLSTLGTYSPLPDAVIRPGSIVEFLSNAFTIAVARITLRSQLSFTSLLPR